MNEASQVLRERIKSSFDAQGLMGLLGAQLGEVTPGRVQILLPARPEVSQQLGYIHAGATSAIADTAGGFAALTMFDASSEILTVEYKINLLNPGRGDYLEAVGTVIKVGRTLAVCRIEVFGVTGDARIEVAVGQQTLIRVDNPRS
jgi:uncharacterized protein (TIGR00369 family)